MQVKDVTPEMIAAAEEMVRATLSLWDASLVFEKLVGEEVDSSSEFIQYRASAFDKPEQVRLTAADVVSLIDGRA